MSSRGHCVLALVLLGACLPHQKHIDAQRQNIEQNFPDSSHTVEAGTRTMHYVRTGSGPNLVVFIHGSPGSWDAFAEFLGNVELQRAARLVSVDRLGFGKSEPTRAEKTLAAQCELIRKIMQNEMPASKPAHVVLVGHSFGGPVAVHLAANLASSVTDLVLLAASVDPELENIEWYQRVGDWSAVRGLLPHSIDNSNQEILTLRSELIQLKPLWSNIHSRVIVVHGLDDSLVPVENVEFIRQMLNHNPPQVSLLANQGHFIPWEQPALVASILAKLLSYPKPGYTASRGANYRK